ncbi:hypothetical protein PAHAL_1G194900 [Panicum hallii]|jgi:hypothetical protein|uniref:Uncharacterized protein n=1 Tax=Panicum hallii TaxID=206008 RepID=A0A2T8KVU8_9POAL|nr:hypothetical protein PAHAL_1G194900 [Panicum hallii]
MAAPSNVFWDSEGHLHTNTLHWEGFPRLLWESLQSFHYTEPSQYDAVEHLEEGVHRAHVRMTIPQHPFRSQWQPIEISMMGYRIVDTIEAAALEAIYAFCNQHPGEVAGQPIGLFATTDPGESEWDLRVIPESHRLEGSSEEALRGMMRFTNVQYHYHSLLRREMGQLINAARSLHGEATRHITQVDQLRALVIEKDGIIATQNETIHHREDQINESDATITQRNTIIEFLQEQIHDLILEVDDANAHINELQQQPVPPAVPASEEEEEDPEEIEGVSEIDSEHGDPVISPYHSTSGSQSSVGNFDDF